MVLMGRARLSRLREAELSSPAAWLDQHRPTSEQLALGFTCIGESLLRAKEDGKHYMKIGIMLTLLEKVSCSLLSTTM